MALAIDGTVHNTTASGTSLAVSLTTTNANDYIMVCISSNGDPITGVSGSTLGAFTQVGLATRDVSTHSQSIWAKFASGLLTSETITATYTTSTFMTMDAFGVSGSGQTSLVFDPAGVQIHNGPGVADPILITTTNAITMVVATFGLQSSSTNSAGAGFTAISGIDWSLVEYDILSATGTTTAACGTPSTSNGAVAIAIVGGGVPPPVNLSSIQQRIVM
jgi:hypothetical protein